MPLPAQHEEALRSELQFHEQRLETLRLQQDQIAREMRMHEMVLELGRSKEVLDALSELADDESAARSARKDARGWASRRGIRLPDELDVNVDMDGASVVVRATHRDDWLPVTLVWHGEQGFSAQHRHTPAEAQA